MLGRGQQPFSPCPLPNCELPLRYDRRQDIDNAAETLVIYAYRQGTGVGQHPNSNRGASTVNFATGDAESECDDDHDEFVSLHGALMLIAWMALAPLGIYFVRCV